MKKYIFLFACLLLTGLLTAQNRVVKKKVNVILFMLNNSSNKIEAFRKRDMKDEMNDVIQADREINSSIIRDFKTHFNFCPVYFFYDSLLQYVKQKKWDSVQFYDYESLQTGKKIEVSSLDGYLIAEVNYPPMSTYPGVDEKGRIVEPEYMIDYASARDYGLLLYNENFQLLRNNMQYTNISLRRKGNVFKQETMQYFFEGAQRFQAKLKKYYTR